MNLWNHALTPGRAEWSGSTKALLKHQAFSFLGDCTAYPTHSLGPGMLCSLPLDSLSFQVAWAPAGMGHQLGQVNVWWGNGHMMSIWKFQWNCILSRSENYTSVLPLYSGKAGSWLAGRWAWSTHACPVLPEYEMVLVGSEGGGRCPWSMLPGTL